ncbi:BH3-interacting domain death agonist [Pelodytes ibericus]
MKVDVELILLTFLKQDKSQDAEFNLALGLLEDKVQSQGSDGELETDGNIPVPSSFLLDVGDVDEDLCRRIGAQLAELGDKLDKEGKIKKEVVECVVQDLLNECLSQQRFTELINSVLENLPTGIEQEKATLAIAMTLTKKVSCTVPYLMERFFRYTASFVEQNYMTYLQQFTRQR